MLYFAQSTGDKIVKGNPPQVQTTPGCEGAPLPTDSVIDEATRVGTITPTMVASELIAIGDEVVDDQLAKPGSESGGERP